MKYELLRRELEQLKVLAQTTINTVDTLPALEKARIEFFGRNGMITKFMKNMAKISFEDRPKLGTAANDIRTELTISFSNRTSFIHEMNERGNRDSGVFVENSYIEGEAATQPSENLQAMHGHDDPRGENE